MGAFSADDELIFLQTQQTSRQQSEKPVAKSVQDVAKAAAAFSWYRWQKASEESSSKSAGVTGDASKPATISAFHKDATKWLGEKAPKMPQKSKTKKVTKPYRQEMEKEKEKTPKTK